jgi:hypothetical protein
MTANKKSVNLLPEYLRTDKNSKFLASTIDQLIQTPQVERLEGYVGSKITPNYNPTTDVYINEPSSLRTEYNLEPALVFKDASNNITDVVSYDDLINEVQNKNKNLNKLFNSEFYSYDPLIDWDKLVNFTDYYWLPIGPDVITLADENLNVSSIIGAVTYTMGNGYKLSNGMRIAFTDTTIEVEYRYKEFIVEGVGSSINLIPIDLLTSYNKTATILDEKFDSTKFDDYGFDSDKKLPLTPDYITINRASKDLNPWSQYNRWFHKDIIDTTSKINNVPTIYPLEARAKRPIIEFRPNLQLYNFGTVGIQNVDLIDTVTTDAYEEVDGTIGYYVDGELLQQGNRVIFNNDDSDDIRGKIFVVTFDISGPTPILRLVEDSLLPNDADSVSINLGTTHNGTSWYFNSTTNKWIYAQQQLTVNQSPLFDLFNDSGVSYTKLDQANNFTGSKIFGYEIGTNTVNDGVLGFPLKYQNDINIGSYLFKNYFMTDSITVISNNLSSVVPTSITYLKLDNNLVNVWAPSTNYQIPIIEIQTILSSTSTLTLTCLDAPIASNLTVSAYINNVKIPVSVTVSTSKVILTTTSTFAVNDVVLLKVFTDQVPNSNGYYETPIGLTNNPLNGSLSNFTLSELGDHLSTMMHRVPGYTGTNLRDIADYTKYGTRLVSNANPIAFAQLFLGKKEHNVVDAIRSAGDHYEQFKMNFLRLLVDIDSKMSPSDAVDTILTTLNKNKDITAPYQRSDMLGYGQNKVVREFTVRDINVYEYPFGIDFDLTKPSFQSVLVYVNDVQVLTDRDYVFNLGSINFLNQLTVGDKIYIHVYLDTIGCYIPPTPSKLGLWPATRPTISEDITYSSGVKFLIQCHDGSSMITYGDYRDAIILEYETRIYNNIKTKYNDKIFDVISLTPGAFRSESLDAVNDIIINDYIKWAGMYGVDIYSNTTFNETDSRTWNFAGSVDKVFGETMSGSWKSLFTYFYDTTLPNFSPWRMLGIQNRPEWWTQYYGTAPYRSTNTLLWTDLRDGYVRGEGIYKSQYARPNLLSIIPVTNTGALRSPETFLVSSNSYQDKQSQWKFGDGSPAELTWRRSSQYRFARIATAALIDPCTYCATMYDVSRTTINSAGQIVYTDDNLFLNPTKLHIEGENNDHIEGFGTYVLEKGKQRDLQYAVKLRQDINYLNFNLFHKLGGFASKDKLQITIDSINPSSTSPGVILPSEDYSLILNTSNPINTASISGIIVQKSNGGFIVRGYDIKNPYFEVLMPKHSMTGGAVKVGGVSEEFTDWGYVATNGNKGLSSADLTSAQSVTTRYYKQGQIVRYNGKFYIVKTGHTAETSFDSSFYQALPSLPVKGGTSAQLPTGYETTITKIPYNTYFTKVQEVYDMILGYGAYLETQGFIFDEFNAEFNEILNWKFTGKEFLYWSTQNWADGNLITLSPFANYIKYNFPNSVVDNISTGKYEYSLLKADGKSYPIDKFTMAREDTVCTIKTTDPTEGLFFATLNSIQKEHAMVFNNYTVFNDTIYDIETGYKQRRIKLSGFRTKNWNGDLFSPGFVFDNVEITDWQAYKQYLPGKIVRYNGKYYESLVKIPASLTFDFTKWDQLNGKPVSKLLPNFDYKINQFEDFYSLDIDNFDFGQQQLAQHLTGYTPRAYLNNIFTNPISQYKFYQGFIKDKGTKNAIDKLSKASEYTNKGEITFKEEWAFRVGHYGSYQNYNEVEFTLSEGTSLENPYVVKFADSIPTDSNPLINFVTPSKLLLTPTDYSSSNTFSSYPGTWVDNNLKLTTAGYVRHDDVTSTAYNKNSLLDIANNSVINNGDTIWLGFLENGDWTVYRYTKQLSKITGVFVSAPGSEITFVTDSHHALAIGDIVSVVRFNEQVNGVYIVTSTPTLNQFTVASKLDTIENAELLHYGALFKFDNSRYSSLDDLASITDLLKLNAGDKVWVDSGTNGKWQVYEKIKNYTPSVLDTVNVPAGQSFGSSIFASDDSPVMLISAPAWRIDGTFNWGRVKVYNRINSAWVRQYDYILNSNQKTYCNSTVATQFGYALQYDISKKLYITGAPEASNIRATGTNILSTGSGFARSYINEGLVKISSRPEEFGIETVDLVLVNTSTYTNSRFGHSIYINQVAAANSTTMLISAPGTTTYASSGSVFAYYLNTVTNTTTFVTTATIKQNKIIPPNPAITLTNGSQWGYKVAGTNDGNTIAISAPGYSTSTGVVQLFNQILQYKQTLFSPWGTNGKFGYDITFSSSNKYLIVAAPGVKYPNEPYGKVAIYTATNLTSTGTYVLSQIIDNPLPTNNLKFGYAISISKDEKTIGISALGTARSKSVVFDKNNNNGTTTFDGDSTKFVETVPDAGAVYLYNKIGNYFIQADDLDDVKITQPIPDKIVSVTLDIPAPTETSPVISNITISANPTPVGETLTVTFHTNVDINYLVAAVDGTNNGPYGGHAQNELDHNHYFYIDTSRLAPGLHNLLIYVKDSLTNSVGTYYTTFTLEPAVYTISPGSKYGTSLVVTNNEVFVGAPSNQVNTLPTNVPDTSRVFIFDKIDTNSQSWKVLRTQEDTVDPTAIDRIALIDTLKEEVIDYLDVIDPVKGKIAGIAEQELKYKAAFDPAVYSIGFSGTIVDTTINWLDEHVSELWWDLSTAKYQWYEQGDELYRKNNWGKLFPGASIDVYEWVKSDLLPSEWAAQADTTSGLTKGISGQPKYPSNNAISVKQVFNNVTGAFENVYYFWVKNKLTLPDVKNRRLNAYQVASYIADPVASGLKVLEILSPNSLAFANVQPLLVGNRINANIAINNNSIIPRHTEWLLLNEGDYSSVPNTILEKKLFDSLLGHDSFGNPVPDLNLTYRNKYGIGIRPQQTLFKDRYQALRNLIYFVNSVLAKNRIVGNYSFENLNKQEEIPAIYSYEYDQLVEDSSALLEVSTINYIQAAVECYVENGKVKSVVITNPGFGYGVAPKITILSTGSSPAEIISEIDNLGRLTSATIINPGAGYVGDIDNKLEIDVRPHTIIVQVNTDYGNRWTKHSFNYATKTWTKVQSQKYNTPLYWETVNWSSTTYNQFKSIEYTIDSLFDIESLVSIQNGDYVKIKNIGDGKFAVLQKVEGLGDYIPMYNMVYREQGTIQLSDKLWNYNLGKYAYDNATIEETLYDQVPDLELYYILTALKNNIFVNSLKVNWNLFFFAAVKYALTEQKLLDWAFKTSFINVQNNIGTLDQRPVYKLNNEEYFENYIKEVKPYHTKIRSYTSIYDKTEYGNIYNTDFDLPSYYNTLTNTIDTVSLSNPLINTYPWKSWKDNYKFYVGAIEVGYTGSGYTSRPSVVITTAPGDTGSEATAEAYIRNGAVYKVIVTNPGSGYTMNPIVTITGGGTTDIARVSVILENTNTRKNTIGMKFDRTSSVGDITELTVTDEFLCDGTSDAFTLTWLASPDKRKITPLLDGKLVFGSDYTIEYYKIKIEHSGLNVKGAFPKNSWEGEKSVDHRYKYYVNTTSADSKPGYIRHYAKFVFINQTPKYGQVLKVTYSKNIELYNAVDRINNLYNPDDLMPGKELNLLMSGIEYPGTKVQGLMLNQTPAWDSTGTRYDSAPWGDYLSSYTTSKLVQDLSRGAQTFLVSSGDGIQAGQFVRALGTSTSVNLFKPNTVVTSVSPNLSEGNWFVTVDTFNLDQTLITSAQAASTASGSFITLRTSDSFYDAINVGDYIRVSGVNSLGGYGIQYVSIVGNQIPVVTSRPVVSTTTDIPSVVATVSMPDLPGGRRAVVEPIFDLNTATSIRIIDPGMGYIAPPIVTFTGTNMVNRGIGLGYIDTGFNGIVPITSCTSDTISYRSVFTLSSTATILSLESTIKLMSLESDRYSSTQQLIETVKKSFDTPTSVAVIETTAPYNNVRRAEVTISTTSTNIASTSTYPWPAGQNPIWYDITPSTDGLNRTVVSIRNIDSSVSISGNATVKLYDYTELEFFSHNSSYNSLDSEISGSNILDSALTGYKPEDIIIDGNNFLNQTDSYSPEECVPGHVRDALGINVYTVSLPSSPLVITGAFGTPANSNGPTRVKLSFKPAASLGFMVYCDGKIFDRVFDQYSFSSSTQYTIYGDEIIVPPQPKISRIGYTFVTAGSDVRMDSAYVATTPQQINNTGTILVSSLLSIDDVKSVFVLINGRDVSPTTTSTQYGYILGPVSSINNRASITMYGLGQRDYSIEVWFFDHPFPNFNRVHDQSFLIDTGTVSELTFELPPGFVEPASEQVIVEKITTTGRHRMLPPWASYYIVRNNIATYAIDSKNFRPNTYSLDNVKTYLNGIELRPGYDFTVDSVAQTVTLTLPNLANGDALAITPIIDYDYIVKGDKIFFTTPVASTATIRLTSFTDHDNMMLRTERFKGNGRRVFTLTYPVVFDGYVWITVQDKQLIAAYDFRILEDQRTIELSEYVDVAVTDDIVVTVVNPPSFGSTVLGYREFKDMFGKQHMHRLSTYFSTKIAEPLEYNHDTIILEDGDHLLQPNPGLNIPGVIVVDSERIEYGEKDGNVLRQLRRSTLGTGPAKFSDAGTSVIDQSLRQKIPTTYKDCVQHIPASNTTTYVISTVSNTATYSFSSITAVGDGIVFMPATHANNNKPVPNAVDQVEVYYGGRQLRKTSMKVHDKSISYYESEQSTTILPPEFTITTSTQQLTLNIAEEINTGTRITVVMRRAEFWTETSSTSLLSSTGTQANFLRSRVAELPDIYYYGGEKTLLEYSLPLTDENGEPFEGY